MLRKNNYPEINSFGYFFARNRLFCEIFPLFSICPRGLMSFAGEKGEIKTIVMYDRRFPFVFVDEFLNPEKVTEEAQTLHKNANKKWTRAEEQFLLTLYHEGKTLRQISQKMGRSQTSIVMRLGKLGVG